MYRYLPERGEVKHLSSLDELPKNRIFYILRLSINGDEIHRGNIRMGNNSYFLDCSRCEERHLVEITQDFLIADAQNF